jgi:hypothetical protein
MQNYCKERFHNILRTSLFFNACILRCYLSKPLTSLSCSLNAVFPCLKMWDTFACATAIYLTHFLISIAVLENVPPDAGLQKRATFPTLNVGLAGTRNRTRATCVASSATNHSAIHYASLRTSLVLSTATPSMLQHQHQHNQPTPTT